MRILIIDDDMRSLQSISMMVKSLGGETAIAAGAQEAISHLQREHFEYILLNMKMPEKDGLWFMRHARIPGDTRAIVMSGFAPGLLLNEMYRLGVCDYLEKPFDSQELLDVLERQSRKGSRCGDLQEVAA